MPILQTNVTNTWNILSYTYEHLLSFIVICLPFTTEIDWLKYSIKFCLKNKTFLSIAKVIRFYSPDSIFRLLIYHNDKRRKKNLVYYSFIFYSSFSSACFVFDIILSIKQHDKKRYNKMS